VPTGWAAVAVALVLTGFGTASRATRKEGRGSSGMARGCSNASSTWTGEALRAAGNIEGPV
jgi:hypothetical protein